MIEAKNINLTTGNRVILNDVSFSAKKGCPLGLIGPNGGGKTSLLRTLAGLMLPSSGLVTIPASSKIGYVPQQKNYQPSMAMSTLEFVASGHPDQNTWGWCLSKKQIQAAHKTLCLVGLQDACDQCIYLLSGGQFQRAAFARAIIDNPDILLLDEPTANTDHASTEQLIRRLLAIRPHVILIVASHDQELLRRVCSDYLCVKCKAEIFSESDVFYHFSQGNHPVYKKA